MDKSAVPGSRSDAAETPMAVVRLALVVVATGVHAGLLQGTYPRAAFSDALALGSIAYAVAVLAALRLGTSGATRRPYAFTAGDNLLVAAWLAMTGGAASPFFVAVFLAIAVTAYRSDLWMTLGVGLAWAVVYVAVGAQSVPALDLWSRAAAIAVVAVVLGLLASEVDRQTEAKTEARATATQLDREVRRRTADLRASEQRLRQSLVDLQEANDRLQELDRMKTRFINTAAHELRTPLTPIKIQLHLLKTSDTVKNDARQHHIVEVLDRNIERLSALIQDTLDATRLQAGRLPMRREPMDLRAVVLDAVEAFRDTAIAAGIQLRVDATTPAVIEADPRRVGQVLFNLLSNAIKFTATTTDRRPGRIDVHVTTQRREVRVVVKDSGPGMDAQQMARLFQPFSQVHETTQDHVGGTGLGLYICRGIVGQHGGRIWVESDGIDQGATFTFTLPVNAPPEPSDVAADQVDQLVETVAERARELV